MGLAEKRASEEYKNGEFKTYQAAIAAIIGDSVQMEIDWDMLAIPERAHLYHETFGPVYFQPLLAALESISRDDMGKDALTKGLVKIKITNSGKYSSVEGFSFNNGVLTLDHQSDTNVHYVADRTKGIITLLENGL